LPAQTELSRQAQTELTTSNDQIQRALEALPLRGSGFDTTSTQITDANMPDAIIGTSRALAEASQRLLTSVAYWYSEVPSNNSAWAIGMAGSSQKMAVSVGQLLSSAAQTVKGTLQEEVLVAEAKKLANQAKQLLLAAATQTATPEWQTYLSDAAKDFARSTSEMVRVAQASGEVNLKKETTRRRSSSTWGVSGAVVDRLEQQAAILRLEKELEEAKRALARKNH
jgi:hypothetical protein